MCGIFAVSNSNDAAALSALGLHALQHRGQESAGIVTFDGSTFNVQQALGYVGDHFNSEQVIKSLPGNMAIGHVRYSTAGGNSLHNIQPLFSKLLDGFGIAHNGNLTNADAWKKKLEQQGIIFESTTDTEVIIHLVKLSKEATFEKKMIDALEKVTGAYSLVAMNSETIIGLRDPHGVRPLVLGKIGNSYILASETCALDIIGAEFIRDIEHGEMIVIKNGDQLESFFPFKKQESSKFCIFEYVYFARPDSFVESKHTYDIRKNIGRELARESGLEADVVVPVPDSGVPAAIGYAQESKIQFDLGIIRNHYVGRTFIEPSDHVRHLGVRLKHNPNQNVIYGKNIILIDDSIVRGTTSKKIVDMLKEAGAKSIHMRIASPPTVHPCFYGIDTPKKSDLLAANNNLEEMRQLIGVDSLKFISIDGLYKAIIETKRNSDNPQFCDACFTGKYPIAINANCEGG